MVNHREEGWERLTQQMLFSFCTADFNLFLEYGQAKAVAITAFVAGETPVCPWATVMVVRVRTVLHRPDGSISL